MDTNNKNWLTERLNKDNFWNLMFWFNIVISVLISEAIARNFEVGLLALGLLIFSVTVIPYLTAAINKVKYLEQENIFLNSTGLSLSDRLPKKFQIVFFINFALSVFIYIPYVLLDNIGFYGFRFATTAALIFALPTVYFIWINCPISILFNKHGWNPNVNGFDPKARFHNPHSHFSASSSLKEYSSLSPNYVSDPRYSSLSCNIHNSNRHK